MASYRTSPDATKRCLDIFMSLDSAEELLRRLRRHCTVPEIYEWDPEGIDAVAYSLHQAYVQFTAAEQFARDEAKSQRRTS